MSTEDIPQAAPLIHMEKSASATVCGLPTYESPIHMGVLTVDPVKVTCPKCMPRKYWQDKADAPAPPSPKSAEMKIGETPFVVADIVPSDKTGAVIRYGTGFNCSGTSRNEVLQHIRHPDGVEHTYVIMRGTSRAKAEAIAMILNAPEVG